MINYSLTQQAVNLANRYLEASNIHESDAILYKRANDIIANGGVTSPQTLASMICGLENFGNSRFMD